MNYSERLHHVIPGGAHTYSRGDDQYPNNAPPILERGEGAWSFDAEGNKYLDYGMGLRSVNIGYGDKEIAEAVYAEALKGNNLTRASMTELIAAELMVELIEGVDMVKFAKHGSTVTTAAVKLARAYTGKKYICVPAEQPFFSYDDWFIGSTVVGRGVPEEISALTLQFNYNNIDSLKALFAKYPGEIACVILEPASVESPCSAKCGTADSCRTCPNHAENFLMQVQALCKAESAVFILDEMISGFRWHLKGAQYYYNVVPDLCTFGKAMANGFALAALCGKREIMQLGSIQNEGAERVFLTSTTHGAEMGALGAFIKTMEVLKRDAVIDHFWDYGTKVTNGINAIAAELGIGDYFSVGGFACSPYYTTKDKTGAVSLAFRTLFAQEMMKEKVIMPTLVISYSHQAEELAYTLAATKKALTVYALALEEGIDKYLHSKVIKPVFRKHN